MFDQYAYLYVEDDLLGQEVMQMIMTCSMGIEDLVVFSNSVDFMKRVLDLKRRPEIILLDIHVLPLNGFEMLALLRSEPEFAHAKVIALTASVMNEEVEKLRVSGFDGAIAKPLNLHSFPELMRQIIAGKDVWHVVE